MAWSTNPYDWLMPQRHYAALLGLFGVRNRAEIEGEREPKNVTDLWLCAGRLLERLKRHELRPENKQKVRALKQWREAYLKVRLEDLETKIEHCQAEVDILKQGV